MNNGLLENKMKVLERLVLQDIHDTYSMQKFSEKSYDELMPRLLDKVVNFYEALELDGVSLRKLNQYGERAEIYKKQLREDLDKAAMVTVRQLVKQLPREKLSGRTTWEVIQDVRPVLKQRMEGLSDLLSVSALQMENYMLLWGYQDLGFSHYCLLTEGENCDACNSLAGQVFPISQACVGENFAPMHPNCNCRVGVLDHKGQVAYVIGAENEEQKGEAKEKNWYDAFLRLPQDAKQLFLDFVRTQNERLNRGDMAGFLDWLTLGTVSGTGQGYRGRWQTLLQDPTLYNAVNYLSSGMSDTVKGAVQPAEALSLQHWLDSLGVVSAAAGAYQMGKNGKAAFSSKTTANTATKEVPETVDDIGNSLVSSKANTLTDIQKSRLNSLDNTIKYNLKESDFSGTLRDLQGNPVSNPCGGYYDHLTEMKQSYISLNKTKRGLEGSLKNPNLSSVDREILQNALDKANHYIHRIEKLFEPFGGIK